MRVRFISIVLGCIALLALLSTTVRMSSAYAQHGAAPQIADRAGQTAQPSVEPTAEGERPYSTVIAGNGNRTAAADRASGTSKPMALFFWLFALSVVGGSIFVITRRNMVVAVMGMVGTFFMIAALYMMLYASFLAVMQVIVYAGAIMVLFVFVVMLLNKPEDSPWSPEALLGKVIAGAAIAYLIFRVGSVLWGVKAPSQMALPPGATAQGYEFGSTAAVGHKLFTDYLFPFEAISILLLIAVVGALAIVRSVDQDGMETREQAP